jgi:hypothetical protein
MCRPQGRRYLTVSVTLVLCVNRAVDGLPLLEAHAYDSQGCGLSSTRANGVDIVTLNYP